MINCCRSHEVMMNFALLTNCCGKCQKGGIMEIMRTFFPYKHSSTKLSRLTRKIWKSMTLQQIPMANVFHRLNIIINNNNIKRGFKWSFLLIIIKGNTLRLLLFVTLVGCQTAFWEILEKSLEENQTEKRAIWCVA